MTFAHDQQGQDLVEYTLLLAFVVLALTSTFIGVGGDVRNIWSAADSRLVQAQGLQPVPVAPPSQPTMPPAQDDQDGSRDR